MDKNILKTKTSKLYFNNFFCNNMSSLELGGILKTFTFEKNGTSVKYNFIKRDISYEVKGLEKGKYFDIITPFDYGGYEFTCKNILPEFFKEFSKYCQQKNIISEFIRFSPTYNIGLEYVKNYLNVLKVNDLIYVDLGTDFWKDYSRGRKSNINKISKMNYQIGIVKIEDFYSLYVETMQRNKAHKYFYFDMNILKNLCLNGLARVFGIYLDNKLVSSIMLLDEEHISYYFLGATSNSLLASHANSMLFHKVAMLLKEEKQEKFFLGGGRSGVYDFKKRFSKKTLPYYIGKKIHNENLYTKLVDMTDRKNVNFFPKYREKTI